MTVRAVIHGIDPSEVRMEFESLDGEERGTHAMLIDEQSHQHLVHWSPPTGKSRFRVVADDAESAWYAIDARPRPKAERFTIEYRYPDYTQLANSTIESDNGNLEALAGSVATVTITANQRLGEGTIQVQSKDRSLAAEERSQSISLSRGSGNRWTAAVPIEREATYRIQLTADETGFTNSYSPIYSILAIADQAPVVKWLDPLDSTLSVEANQLLTWRVSIEDELPIASVVFRVKAAASDWNEQALPVGDLAKQEVDCQLDLSSLDVKAGDAIQCEMVATDRKGQATVSAPITLFVTSVALDPNRHSQMLARLEVAKRVSDFHQDLEKQTQAMEAARSEWKNAPEDRNKQQAWRDSIHSFTQNARLQAAPASRIDCFGTSQTR